MLSLYRVRSERLLHQSVSFNTDQDNHFVATAPGVTPIRTEALAQQVKAQPFLFVSVSAGGKMVQSDVSIVHNCSACATQQHRVLHRVLHVRARFYHWHTF